MISGQISGGGSLTKKGAGRLTLSGNNTYTGPTTIEEGELRLTGSGILDDGAKLIVSGGGEFVLDSGGHTKKIGSLSGLGTINLNDNTLEVSRGGDFEGVIQGSSGRLKVKLKGSSSNDSYRLTLSGENSYTRGTLIEWGSLVISSDKNLGDPAGEIMFDTGILSVSEGFDCPRDIQLLGSSGAMLGVGSGAIRALKGRLTLSGIISGTGDLIVAGEGITVLSGFNTYSGRTFLVGGLSISQDSNLGSSGSDLVLSGGKLEVTGSFTSARDILLQRSAAIDVLDNSLTLSGVLSGTGSLDKEGEGTLTLSGVNTHTGQIRVKSGRLALSRLGVLGGQGNQLDIQGGGVLLSSGAQAKTVGTLRGTAGARLDLSDNTFEVGGGEFLGVIEGIGAKLKKVGVGTLTLSGDNTYTGGTSVEGGVLALSSDANLGDVAGGVALKNGTFLFETSFASDRRVTLMQGAVIEVKGGTSTLSGVVVGVGELKKKGAGTLLLSGVNTYSGGVTLSEGLLGVSSDQNLGASSPIRFEGGGLLVSSDLTSSRNGVLAGSGEVEVSSSKSFTLSGVLSGSGLFEKSGEGTLLLSGVNTYQGKTVLSGGVLGVSADHNLGNSSSSLEFDGGTLLFSEAWDCSRDLELKGAGKVDIAKGSMTLSGTISGEGSIEKSGSGELTLSGDNTHKGGTILSHGKLMATSNQNFGDELSPIHFRGGVLELSTGFEMARAILLEGSSELDVKQGTLSLSGSITGSGSLVKEGEGRLALEGDNSYTGILSVAKGVLRVSRDENLGGVGAKLELGSSTLLANGSFTSSKEISLTGSATVETGKHSVILSGDFSGSGSLKKRGEGVLTLLGSNQYSGGTTIDQGTLKGTTKSLQGDITNHTVILFDQTADGTFLGMIQGNGSLIKEGSGTVTFSRPNTYTGNTIIRGGHLKVANVPESELHLDGGSLHLLKGVGKKSLKRLEGRSAGLHLYDNHLEVEEGHFEGDISGEEAVLSKVGEGKLVLTGTNRHVKATEIKEGILNVASEGSLGDAKAPLKFKGGTLEVSRSFVSQRPMLLDEEGVIDVKSNAHLKVEGEVSGEKGIAKKGVGSLLLTGENRFKGDVSVHQGTLGLSSEKHLGEGVLKLKGGKLLPIASMKMNKQILVETPSYIETHPSIHLSLSGSLKGESQVRKVGRGTLNIEGDQTAFKGQLLAQEGVVSASGKLGGSLRLGVRGKLIGTGQVGSLSNSGVVSPGFSIGTLTVSGDYKQHPLADLRIELESRPNYSSKLIAHGKADLGGVLTLKLQPGFYQANSKYTVLQAQKVGGSFDQGVTVYDRGEDLSPSSGIGVNYLDDRVELNFLVARLVLSINPKGLTGNARAAFDYIAQFTQTELGDLWNVFAALSKISKGLLTDALEQLGPEQLGALALDRLQSNGLVQREMTASEIGDQATNTLWLRPIGAYYKQEKEGELLPFNSKIYGVTLGGGKKGSNGLLLSGGFGYTRSNLNWAIKRGDAEIQSVYLTPSFGIEKGWGYAKAYASAIISSYHVNRDIHFSGIGERRAKSSHKSHDLSIGFAAGLKVDLSSKYVKSLLLLPTLNLDYLNLFEKGYQESGADSLDLSVQKKRSSFLRLDTKIRCLKHFDFRSFRLSPSLYAGLIRAISLTEGTRCAKLKQEEQKQAEMVVQSYQKLKSQAALGAELLLSDQKRYSFNVGYEINLGDKKTIQEGKIGFNLKF